MTPKYLSRANYDRIVAAVLLNPTSFNVPSCPFAGRPTENEVRITLGEDWNIWPMSILPDVIDAHRRELAQKA